MSQYLNSFQVFIKYEELDKLERDQLKGGNIVGEDLNNNILNKPAKNDVRFAAENQIFSRSANFNNEFGGATGGRAIPTIRPSAAAKSGKASATTVPNGKQTDLM